MVASIPQPIVAAILCVTFGMVGECVVSNPWPSICDRAFRVD